MQYQCTLQQSLKFGVFFFVVVVFGGGGAWFFLVKTIPILGYVSRNIINLKLSESFK